MPTAPVTKPDVAATPAAAPVSTAQEIKIKASAPAKEAPRSIVHGHADGHGNGHTNGHANGVNHVKSGSETRSPVSHRHALGCTCHLCKDVGLAHHHGAGCGCHRCIRAINEVTSISEPYCPNPNLPNTTKDYETKVRVIQKIPEMRKVEKTFFVKQLVHEDRITIVKKISVIPVDVENLVQVPVIKEVSKLKKFKVHKIHEEIRTHTYEVPVIEYERRCTIKRIPRVQMVDLEEEIEVPVIKEVPMVVKVQVPTGGFCENPIEEYLAPGDFNLLCKDGRHHGDHHKHVDGEFNKPQEPVPKPQEPVPKPQEPVPKSHGPVPKPQEPVPKPHGPVPKPQEPVPKPQEPMPKPHGPVPKPQEPVPKPHEPVPKPQEPVPKPQEPVPKPHEPVPKPQEPVPKPHEPVPKPHGPVPKPHEPVPKPQEPMPKPHEPVPKPQEPMPKPHEPVPKPHKRTTTTYPQVL